MFRATTVAAVAHPAGTVSSGFADAGVLGVLERSTGTPWDQS